MPRKSYKPEEIVAKLRQVDVLTSQGHAWPRLGLVVGPRLVVRFEC
jgi:hypothetical protein